MNETATTLDRITALSERAQRDRGRLSALTIERDNEIRRARRNHTLAAIAEAAGVSVQYVSKVCKEER